MFQKKIRINHVKEVMKMLNGNRNGIDAPWSKHYNYFYVDLPEIRVQIIPNYYKKGFWGIDIVESKKKYYLPAGYWEYKNIPESMLPVLLTMLNHEFKHLNRDEIEKYESIDKNKLSRIGE